MGRLFSGIVVYYATIFLVVGFVLYLCRSHLHKAGKWVLGLFQKWHARDLRKEQLARERQQELEALTPGAEEEYKKWFGSEEEVDHEHRRIR